MAMSQIILYLPKHFHPLICCSDEFKFEHEFVDVALRRYLQLFLRLVAFTSLVLLLV